MLLGRKLTVTQELYDGIEWRNKLAHHVQYAEKPTYPTKDDVLSFIRAADSLVNSIDASIGEYKACWIPRLS